MKKNYYVILLIIFLVFIAGFIIWLRSPEDTWVCEGGIWVKHGSPSETVPTTGCGEKIQEQADIEIFSPLSDTVITSPLEITGQARGSWYFEGSFPVQLTTIHGLVLGNAIAEAQSDWMTDDYVPFKVTLSFNLPESAEQGELIFEKDNPSGLPEHGAEYRLPVKLIVE
jgi:hypothetical protein